MSLVKTVIIGESLMIIEPTAKDTPRNYGTEKVLRNFYIQKPAIQIGAESINIKRLVKARKK